jgi:hypothetical protein
MNLQIPYTVRQEYSEFYFERAVIQNKNLITVHHRIQPVSNREDGTVRKFGSNCFLNETVRSKNENYCGSSLKHNKAFSLKIS